jgi:predicted DNA-binding mobile mystery protein A
MQMRQVARSQLDRRTTSLRELPAESLARPQAGWVRAVREALGMSTRDLAARLGVTSTAVSKLEASEQAGTARLGTLARAADALGCDLAYVLVPRVPLQEQVARQAEAVARVELGPVVTTMALEGQSVSAEIAAQMLAQRAAELAGSRYLWRTVP